MDGQEVQFTQHTSQNISAEMISIEEINDLNKFLPEVKTSNVQLASELSSQAPPPKEKARPPVKAATYLSNVSMGSGLTAQPQEAAVVSSPVPITQVVPQPVP